MAELVYSRDGKQTLTPPPATLIAVAVLIAFTLLAVFIGRGEGVGAAVRPESNVVASLAFRAEDQIDGSIAIRDAASQSLVTMIQPQQDGFIRATLRGLANARQHAGQGPETPFQLTRFEDGRILLTDPVTNREIVLEAFGQSNVAAFARLLTPEVRTR